MNGEQIWQAAQEELRFQLSKPSYETWLKNASLVGRLASVIVSPIFASLIVLIPAKMNPASPTPNSSALTGFGENTPT